MSLGKNYQSLLLIIAGIAVLALLVHSAMRSSGFHGLFSSGASDVKEVFFGQVAVAVDIAATVSAREQGLSGRTSLPAGHGMLFIFDNDGGWGIWMKEMRFSIDIVWVDSAGRVVTIEPSVSPETYPKIFTPSLPARYVVELPAGFAQSNAMYEGMQMTFGTSTPR